MQEQQKRINELKQPKHHSHQIYMEKETNIYQGNAIISYCPIPNGQKVPNLQTKSSKKESKNAAFITN